MKWETVLLGDVLSYQQPTKFIVESDQYNDSYKTPVLTAGKSFILGYTNELENIFTNLPVIIFDDFTAESKFVDFPFKVKSSAMKILSCNPQFVDIRFAFYLLQTLKVDTEQHKRYWISKFATIQIPLPPLPIQKRIADILDAADALRKKDEALLKKYDELAQAIFIDMFGDPVKNEKGWEVKRLEEETSFIDYRGKTPERTIIGEVPLITAKNVKFGYYNFSEKDFVTFEKYNEIMTRGFPMAGDILFTTEGATLGNVCRIPDFPKFAIGQRLISMSGNKVTHEYLQFFMCTDYFQEQVYKYATGSAVKGIRSAVLKKLLILVPEIEKQKRFSTAIQSIEKQKIYIENSITNSENNFSTLIQKAFTGELVS